MSNLRRLLVPLCLSAVAFLVVACDGPAGGAAASASAMVTSAPIRPGVLAEFARTSCGLGFCPLYTVTVYEDGRVAYQGRENVKTIGAATSKIDDATMETLRNAFRDAKFLTFDDSLFDPKMAIHDSPSTELYYAEGGKAQRVHRHYTGQKESETFSDLEKAFDKIVGIEKWIGTDQELMEMNSKR